MGILSSIKAKMFGSGESTEIPVERVNDYREVQDYEVRDEGRVGLISHDEGKLKPVDTEIRKKARRELVRSIKEKGVTGEINRGVDYVVGGIVDTGSRALKPETARSAIRSVSGGVSRVASNVGKKVYRKGKEVASDVAESAVSTIARPFDTREKRLQRIEDEDIKRYARETAGMTVAQKEAYKTTRFTQRREAAIEKAKRNNPIGETAEEKHERLKKKRERKEEVAHAYQKSKASAAGTEAGKAGFGSGIFDITRPQKEDGREIRNPVSSGLVPHGFLPPNQGYAPGFGGNRQQLPSAPISQSGELYNPMFVSQAPPVPQPERRMSRNESHRQQVRNDTQRWKQEQIQQYQQQMYNQFAPQAPPQRDGRNEPYQQPQNGARPQFIDMFAGHQPTNNNGKGSEQQSHPHMKNLFQRDDAPTNNKIAGHEPHPLAKFSGELLNISGNGKKKYVKALWEV